MNLGRRKFLSFVLKGLGLVVTAPVFGSVLALDVGVKPLRVRVERTSYDEFERLLRENLSAGLLDLSFDEPDPGKALMAAVTVKKVA